MNAQANGLLACECAGAEEVVVMQSNGLSLVGFGMVDDFGVHSGVRNHRVQKGNMAMRNYVNVAFLPPRVGAGACVFASQSATC